MPELKASQMASAFLNGAPAAPEGYKWNIELAGFSGRNVLVEITLAKHSALIPPSHAETTSVHDGLSPREIVDRLILAANEIESRHRTSVLLAQVGSAIRSLQGDDS